MNSAVSIQPRRMVPEWFRGLIRLDTTRSRRWALGMVGLAAAILAVLFYSSTWRTGDDGRYYVLGLSLANGAGLVQYDNPLQPPVTLTPPVYPALLALFIRLTSDPVVGAKVLNHILFVAIACLAVGMLSGPARSSRAGWMGACMGVFSVGFVSFASFIMADMLFIFITYACLLASLQTQRREGLAPFLIGCGCGLAYLTRNAGMTLAPAILLTTLTRRQWKRMFWVGLGVAVVVAPWFYRRIFILDLPDPYMQFVEIHAAAHHGKRFADHALWMMGAELVRDAPAILFRVIPTHFFYSAHKVAGSAAFWNAATLFVGAGSLAGLMVRIRRWNEVDWFYVLSILLLSAMPGGYDKSYFYPLLPIAAAYFFHFLFWTARHLQAATGRPRAGWGPRALALTVFAFSLLLDYAAGMVHVIKEAPRRPHPPWAAERFLAYGVEYYDAWARVSDAAEWIRQNTPPDALLLSRKPDHLFILSGRHGWRYEIPREVGCASIMEAVETFAPSHRVLLLEDSFPSVPGTWAYGNNREAVLDHTVRLHPERWRLEHETEAPLVRVWSYVPPPPEAAAP